MALRIPFVSSGWRRLEHGQHRRVIEVARRDTFEVRANTAQFRRHKTIDKMQASIQPGKQFVPDLIVHRQRNLGAVWANFGEINDSHQLDISARGLERILVGRVAIDRQKHRVRLKSERTPKAKIDRFRRSHHGPRHHEELSPVRLDTGQTGFALCQRLAHV